MTHSLPPLFNRFRQSGLTLTELLLAVVLIAVLALIVFPAIRSVSAARDDVRCASNIRKVGALVLQWSVEHQGRLMPAVRLRPPSYTSGAPWNSLLNESGIMLYESYSGLKSGVMTCPARDAPSTYIYNEMHYGMNRNVGFDNIGFEGRPYYHLTKLKSPQRTLLLAEVKQNYMLEPSNQAALERNSIFPHNGHCNLFFFDGHMEKASGPFAPPKLGDSDPFY